MNAIRVRLCYVSQKLCSLRSQKNIFGFYFQSIWRTATLVQRTFPASCASLRTLTSVTPDITKPIENVPVPTIEFDKLYKRVELEMRGIDPAVLLSYSWFCVAAASHLGIEVTKRCVLILTNNRIFHCK